MSDLLIVPQTQPGEQLERTRYGSLFNRVELRAPGFKTTCFITVPCIKPPPFKIIVSKSSKTTKLMLSRCFGGEELGCLCARMPSWQNWGHLTIRGRSLLNGTCIS